METVIRTRQENVAERSRSRKHPKTKRKKKEMREQKGSSIISIIL